MTAGLERLAACWQAAERVVVLTGAGLSTASGIPDFRSPGGRWSRYQPVTIQEFLASEDAAASPGEGCVDGDGDRQHRGDRVLVGYADLELQTGDGQVLWRGEGLRLDGLPEGSFNGRYFLHYGADGTSLVSARAGEVVATIVGQGDDWFLVTPDGRVDTNAPEKDPGAHWALTDASGLHAVPIEAFLEDRFTPGLFPLALAEAEGAAPRPQAMPVASRRFEQPAVTLLPVHPEPGDPGRVRVTARVVPEGASGARDLRLFREGQLVGWVDGPVADAEAGAGGGA